ncbi:MAG: terminase small subunit [Beduini sp.]|uniref:terminase small subunit n=1 Tax=Beduini sp. TaxID=1922300 RepID=UPI0039A0F7A2
MAKYDPYELAHMTNEQRVEWGEERRNEALMDFLNGMTYEQIAKKYEVDKRTVQTWNKKYWGSIPKTEAKQYKPLIEKDQTQRIKTRMLLEKLSKLRGVMHTGRPRINSAEEFNMAFTEYIELCYQGGMNPTINGLATFIGITKNTLSSWENGQLGNEIAYEVRLAHQFIEEFDDAKAQDGEVRDAVYIWRSKNYHGMVDKVETTIHTTHEEDRSIEEITRRLDSMNQVTIDADYTEK